MNSSSMFGFMLVTLCLLFVTINGVSLNGEKESLLLPRPSLEGGKDVVTCPVPQNQCGSECERRCSATSHKKPCLLYCNKCCNKCLCVPPGTFGNKECCPCYNNWKTQEGKPKCP